MALYKFRIIIIIIIIKMAIISRVENGTTEEMSPKSFHKTVSDRTDVAFCNRVFHSWEAATSKARSPIVERPEWRMSR